MRLTAPHLAEALGQCHQLEAVDLVLADAGSLDWVSDLRNLRRLVVRAASSVPSLTPIAACELLEHVYVPTPLDGLLSPVLQLPRLRILALDGEAEVEDSGTVETLRARGVAVYIDRVKWRDFFEDS